MALTPKQQSFINEYLVDLNSTASAIRAGYSPKTAESIGYENLRKPQIAKELQKAMDERAKRTGITADHVLKEIASIADDDISNYLDFRTEKVQVGVEDNKPIYEYKTIADLKDSRTINTKNISEISIGKDGQFKFKLYCRDEALVNLGKHLKLFTDNVNLSGSVAVQILDDID
jgi:phage terminase small subunit